jgi:hypothetical protein
MNTLDRSNHVSDVEVHRLRGVQVPHRAARRGVTDQCFLIRSNIHQGVTPQHPIISRRRLGIVDHANLHHVTVTPNVSRRPSGDLWWAMPIPHNAGVAHSSGRGRSGFARKSTSTPRRDNGHIVGEDRVLSDPGSQHGMLRINLHLEIGPSACTTVL